MLQDSSAIIATQFNYHNDSIKCPGCLFTFGTSREGAYSRQGAYLGQGAHFFFFEENPNMQTFIFIEKEMKA